MSWKVDRADSLPLTGTTTGNNRLQVDPSNTAFWEGKEFRVRLKVVLASQGDSVTFKVVTTTNVVLLSQIFIVTSGGFLYQSFDASQVTEATPFSTPVLTVYPNNLQTDTPPYTITTTAFAGGTINIIPGQEDLARDEGEVKSTGAVAQQTSVGGAVSNERGVAPNTYYFKFTANSNTTKGYVYFLAEERP